MKSRFRVLTVIAAIVAMGFLFAACDNPSGGGGNGGGDDDGSGLVFERYDTGYRVVGYGDGSGTTGGIASGVLVIPATRNRSLLVSVTPTLYLSPAVRMVVAIVFARR